jgi:Tol biopolymer transport system component
MVRANPGIALPVLAVVVVACGSGLEKANTTRSDTLSLSESSGASAADRFSSKNGRIAWTSVVPNGPDTFGLAIVSADPDGTDLRQLTFPEAGGFDDGDADWSPDGASLVFERDFDIQDFHMGDVVAQLYRINADGSGLSQIGDCTGDCVGNAFPSYSPDGKHIAFIKWIGPVRSDGNVTSGGIWIMKADGTQPVQITQRQIPTSQEDSRPHWSPDGQELVFTRLNTTAEPLYHQAVFVGHVDGRHVHRITPWELDATSSDWSPDGKLILVSAHHDAVRPGKEEIYSVHPDGSNLVKITPRGLEKLSDSPRFAANGRFSPNQKEIAFQHQSPEQAAVDYCCLIYKMKADGHDAVQIGPSVPTYAPAWGRHP